MDSRQDYQSHDFSTNLMISGAFAASGEVLRQPAPGGGAESDKSSLPYAGANVRLKVLDRSWRKLISHVDHDSIELWNGM